MNGVIDNRDDEAIATTIITLGKSLNLNVVAEGVENEMQRYFLEERGCDVIQGYHISRPMPAAEVSAWHAQWTQAGEKP